MCATVYKRYIYLVSYEPPMSHVVKTGSDDSTAKRSAIGVSVTGPRR